MSANPVSELEKTKAALERYKKFADGIRTAPLEFLSLEKITAIRCTCCGAKPSHVSTYPFHDSAEFARQVVAWCSQCGFGMTPDLSFSLQNYYEERYAIENRGDRNLPPAEYFALQAGEDAPPNLKRYLNRATDQLKRIKRRVPKLDSILDVGSGPGYALHLSGAREKDAIEYDKNSKKYLDYIGANIVTWDSIPKDKYDAVLMSHVLEHFLPHEVEPRLRTLYAALKPSGILYIEVPPGGLGWKNFVYKHEPHTLFFTPQALHTLCTRLEFEVVFQGPMAKAAKNIEPRSNPIYEPRDEAFADPRGRMTIICRKRR